MVSKLISNGMLFNGKKSYLRNFWNVTDFVILILALISIYFSDSKLQVTKVIRMGRLMRPLRVISKNENLKLSIFALAASIPAISQLLIIVSVVLFIFAIVGVNLLKGMSNYCDTSQLVLSADDLSLLIDTKEDCINYGGDWDRYHYHFDNIQNSFINLICMTQVINWWLLMYTEVNARGPDLVPAYKHAHNLAQFAPFFVFYIVFGSLYLMSLFIGVVI